MRVSAFYSLHRSPRRLRPNRRPRSPPNPVNNHFTITILSNSPQLTLLNSDLFSLGTGVPGVWPLVVLFALLFNSVDFGDELLLIFGPFASVFLLSMIFPILSRSVSIFFVKMSLDGGNTGSLSSKSSSSLNHISSSSSICRWSRLYRLLRNIDGTLNTFSLEQVKYYIKNSVPIQTVPLPVLQLVLMLIVAHFQRFKSLYVAYFV